MAIRRCGTTDPFRVELRHEDGFVVGSMQRSRLTPALVGATDVLGRRLEPTGRELAELWIRNQYATVGTVEMMDSAKARIATTGQLVGSVPSPELVARLEQLQWAAAGVPEDVSERLDQAARALVAADELAAANPSTANAQRWQRLKGVHGQLRTTLAARHRWIDQHTDELREYEAVNGQLHWRRMKREEELWRGEVGREVLGPPPGRNAEEPLRRTWDTAVTEYINVEQRHGTVDLADRQATRRLRWLVERLHQGRQPERDLGPSVRRS